MPSNSNGNIKAIKHKVSFDLNPIIIPDVNDTLDGYFQYKSRNSDTKSKPGRKVSFDPTPTIIPVKDNSGSNNINPHVSFDMGLSIIPDTNDRLDGYSPYAQHLNNRTKPRCKICSKPTSTSIQTGDLDIKEDSAAVKRKVSFDRTPTTIPAKRQGDIKTNLNESSKRQKIYFDFAQNIIKDCPLPTEGKIITRKVSFDPNTTIVTIPGHHLDSYVAYMKDNVNVKKKSKISFDLKPTTIPDIKSNGNIQPKNKVNLDLRSATNHVKSNGKGKIRKSFALDLIPIYIPDTMYNLNDDSKTTKHKVTFDPNPMIIPDANDKLDGYFQYKIRPASWPTVAFYHRIRFIPNQVEEEDEDEGSLLDSEDDSGYESDLDSASDAEYDGDWDSDESESDHDDAEFFGVDHGRVVVTAIETEEPRIMEIEVQNRGLDARPRVDMSVVLTVLILFFLLLFGTEANWDDFVALLKTPFLVLFVFFLAVVNG